MGWIRGNVTIFELFFRKIKFFIVKFKSKKI
jgi:hypothetical protein